LKLLEHVGVLGEPPAFDRTYEGLKLMRVPFDVGVAKLLLTVPMRV